MVTTFTPQEAYAVAKVSEINENTNVLVLAPHADDEAFGCGGTIKKMSMEGATVHLGVAALGEDMDISHQRHTEMEEAAAVLGINDWSIFSRELDARLDTIPLRQLVSWIERILRAVDYEYIFLPYPSHHQDHKALQEAAIAAMRPGTHAIPRNILMYEYTYPSWSNYQKPDGRFFVDITFTIQEKLMAIRKYKSQLRQFPHPVSVDAAEALAKMRGMAIGAHYAEMFYVVQVIGAI